MNKKISTVSLTVLIIAAIDNMKNLPAAALFGPSLIFFFLFSALVFLIPTSLVAAELSAAFPKKGGVYQWVHMAFGKKWAMAAIWLQWINTMVWYPTMLSFVAGTLAYLIDPQLAQNKLYLITCILTIFWGLTFINMKGIRVSVWFNNICSTLGTIVPLVFLIVLGAIWIFSGQPLQMHLAADNVVPSLTSSSNWVSLIAIMASFLGVELAGVHVNDVHNPQRNFPRAILFAFLFIFLSMSLGSMAIAFVLPGAQISLTSGVMQVFHSFFHAFGLNVFMPIITLLIAAGSIGTMINWLISPAKGLLHAAEFGFLPPFFKRKNRAGVASNILLAQAILVSAICLVFLLEPTVNAFFWFLTALSTELYMIMYVLMFCACIRLRSKLSNRQASFKIPGKQWGLWGTALLGLFGCASTILVSFFPPDNIDIGSTLKYLTLIGIGNIITIGPLFLFYRYQKKKEAANICVHETAV